MSVKRNLLVALETWFVTTKSLGKGSSPSRKKQAANRNSFLGAGFLHYLRADFSIIAKEKVRPCLNNTLICEYKQFKSKQRGSYPEKEFPIHSYFP